MAGRSWFDTSRERLKVAAKRAEPYRAYGQAAVIALSPLGAPVAEHAHIEPIPTPTEIRHNIDSELQQQWAKHELSRLQAEAGKLVRPGPEQHGDVPTRKLPAREAARDAGRSRSRQNGR